MTTGRINQITCVVFENLEDKLRRLNRERTAGEPPGKFSRNTSSQSFSDKLSCRPALGPANNRRLSHSGKKYQRSRNERCSRTESEVHQGTIQLIQVRTLALETSLDARSLEPLFGSPFALWASTHILGTLEQLSTEERQTERRSPDTCLFFWFQLSSP